MRTIRIRKEQLLFIIANEGYKPEFLAKKTDMTPDQIHAVYKAVFDKGLYGELKKEAEPYRMSENYLDRMTFAGRLRKLMSPRLRKKTATQIAAEMGIHPNLLYKYQKGTNRPRRATLEKMAGYFNVTPEWLLNGRD